MRRFHTGFGFAFSLAAAVVMILTISHGNGMTFAETNWIEARIEAPPPLASHFTKLHDVAEFASLESLAAPEVAPIDRNDEAVAYAIANQVGQSWRSAVDAYQHIDPGRRLI